MAKQKKKNYGLWYAALAVLVLIVLINQYQMFKLSDDIKNNGNAVASAPSTASFSGGVIPKGVPEIYGEELGISFDDVSPENRRLADITIRKLAQLDLDIQLEGEDLQRYISVVSKISCEYCCGAESIIFSNGQPACGCAHSYAMRGLAKYLITEHNSEYTDEEILEELGKWKTLFFPNQITQKAGVLESQGVELNYINLASNKYRGAEQGAGGGMVGGC